MLTVYEVLQPLAVTNGYKVEETRTSFFVLPVYDDRTNPEDLQYLAKSALEAEGYTSIGIPHTTDVWSVLTFCAGARVFNIQFPIWLTKSMEEETDKPTGHAIHIDNSTVFLMFLFWMFGIVVTPGWWKLTAVLIFPPFYMGVQHIFLALGGVLP